METIKLYQTSLVLYSAEEWQDCKKGSSTTLGFYNPTFGEWDIHMLKNQEELEKAFFLAFGRKPNRFLSWEAILLHEYVHYLQHSKGCWDEMIPLGLGTCPISNSFKKVYLKEDWLIEAEAHWIMYRPHLLGNWKPPKLE